MTGSASTTRNVAEAHARLQAHGEIQFDLPQARPAETPTWLRALGDFVEWLSPYSGWIFWGAVVLAGAVLLYALARRALAQLRDRDASAGAMPDEARWRPEAKAARALLAEADAMAEAGRFEEAARLLLHRSLEDIAGRRPGLLRPALTSREIARVAELPRAARRAFAAMAAPVERSLFGGRSLDRAAWEEARAAYRAFALPEAWA